MEKIEISSKNNKKSIVINSNPNEITITTQNNSSANISEKASKALNTGKDTKSDKYQENIFLKNKTKRNEKSNTKEISKRNTLRKQLEFYLSDENLINDKFLQRFFEHEDDRGVPITIIEGFNKIKEILSDVKEPKQRIEFIRDAVEVSSVISLNKKKSKIVRINDFDPKKIDRTEMDNRTIYIENLPNNVTHSIIANIFGRCGKVIHVSIPKFSFNKKPKGFAFVIFEVIYIVLIIITNITFLFIYSLTCIKIMYQLYVYTLYFISKA